jgi:CheY-like chemotaxis protein/ribonuclease BN (tRNA processing enzyme)
MSTRSSILITDDSKLVVRSLTKALAEEDYDILIAEDGEECLNLIKEKKPELIFLDIMLPKVHGIDILKSVKGNPDTENIGIIMSTGRALQQDYLTAVANGADYYLTKPFTPTKVRELVSQYFAGTLEPAPFATERTEKDVPYSEPISELRTTYAKFWGTRGSIPVSGLDYFKYGGNTSCLELRRDDELIIIDAGSGIRELGADLFSRKTRTVHLVIGHTHWDHIMGFPFFGPVYSPEFKVKIYAAKGFHKSLQELFSGMLDHDYFPVRLEEMQAQFEFVDLSDNAPIEVADLKLYYHYANHPGSTLCFKVETPRTTIGYASDNEILLGYHGDPKAIGKDHPALHPYKGMVDFYTGCDILVHEAQYTAEEYRTKVGWGHSSIPNAAVLVKHAGIKEWIATHHDPVHSDSFLQEKLELHRNVLKDLGVDCQAQLAFDGMTLPL